MKKTVIQKNGLGFTTALTLAFIILKLCNVITWSWIWVLAPLWIMWTFVLIIAVILGIVAAKSITDY